MSEKAKVALIYGSTREGRFCDTVARWVRRQIEADGRFAVEIVDPQTLPAAADASSGFRQALAWADAFVVVTPEYNHSYPAALKALIDSVKQEWQSKPVGFVSYGGVSGGLRAVEHLRLVFAELHAVTLRDTVSFANPWSRFGPDGTLADGRDAELAMKRQLAHLEWWAKALQNARALQPYGDIAA